MANSATGLLIKQLKNENDLTSTELAKILGVNKPSVTKWETTGQVSLENLCKLSTLFRVSVQELLEGKLQTEGNPDYFKRNYNLGSFDLDALLTTEDEEGLTDYYETCLRIKERFLQLIPLFAYNKLTDTLYEEWEYLNNYVFIDDGILPAYQHESVYELLKNRGIDKNQMAAARIFLERIEHLPKVERDWEMDKLINFRFNLKAKETIRTRLVGPFKPLFKLLSQVGKDSVLSQYLESHTLAESSEMGLLEIMISAGANIVFTQKDVRYPACWDNTLLPRIDGSLTIDENYANQPGIEEIHSFLSIIYSYEWKNMSYSGYERFIDFRRTRCLREIVNLRTANTMEYFNRLKAGKYLFVTFPVRQ